MKVNPVGKLPADKNKKRGYIQHKNKKHNTEFEEILSDLEQKSRSEQDQNKHTTYRERLEMARSSER